MRATCPRASVGTVIARDHRILTTGYNGSPPRTQHCTEVGCLIIDNHCVRTTHSETNAVIQAALHGVSLAEATAYVTHEPCLNCSKVLITAGITRIVYTHEYEDQNARRLRDEASITTEFVPTEK